MISLSSFFISPLRSAGITPTLRVGVCVITLLAVWLGWVRGAEAASLHLSPVTGSFEVDATFDVGVYLDTEGQAVNAVAVNLAFPPDKLQLVSPVVAGQSIVEVWSAQPRFSNQDGLVELAGGIPGGITTSRGLITTSHFRVRSVGTALVRYQDSSQVLLHDGKGTNALYDTSSGIFELTLPAPAGPEVVSVTHPDQAKWYPSSNVSLGWEGEAEVEGYSYLLSDKPIDLVDDIAEGKQVSVVYENVADGVHYFHIKSLRKGKWGGVTHRAIKVDSTPPADFPIDIVPAARTIRRQPIIQFSTTDSGSGLSHYEVKLVLLHSNEAQAAENSSFESIFVETQSPY
ncbi:MAG: hypothetical protein U1C53_01960, partial [Candidatus Veblenbacteria bacterium]|nr:hypothetical protein [Candidatus Veblenbacteria bacterium]